MRLQQGGIVYIFLGGWDKTFFMRELGKWVGLTQGEVKETFILIEELLQF